MSLLLACAPPAGAYTASSQAGFAKAVVSALPLPGGTAAELRCGAHSMRPRKKAAALPALAGVGAGTPKSVHFSIFRRAKPPGFGICDEGLSVR